MYILNIITKVQVHETLLEAMYEHEVPVYVH